MDQDLDRLDQWRKAVARRIRMQRAAFNLSQKDAAALACIHQSTWSRLERGEAALTDDVVIRVAKAIGVSEAYLLCGIDQPMRDGVAA